MRKKSFTNFTAQLKEKEFFHRKVEQNCSATVSKTPAGGSRLSAQTAFSLIPSFLMELGRGFPIEMTWRSTTITKDWFCSMSNIGLYNPRNRLWSFKVISQKKGTGITSDFRGPSLVTKEPFGLYNHGSLNAGFRTGTYYRARILCSINY